MWTPAETHDAASRYCARWAEQEVGQLQDFPADTTFSHCIAIPAYNEGSDFLTALRDLARRSGELLVILVINQPDDDEDTKANDDLFTAAMDSGEPLWQCGNLQLLSWPANSALLLVDRFTDEGRIKRREGVGRARKIACDLAVALRLQGRLRSDFIHNTDADASLPDDYLQQIDQQMAQAGARRISAFTFPFRHHCDDSPLGRATGIYEQSLEHYVSGLRWAGSPYAFHSIGSCLGLNIAAYCMARGFPRRAGGEDFYLLNKLAKLAAVLPTAGNKIVLAARTSDRVPFGTGPAVARIMALENPEQFRSYDPHLFAELARLLRHLDTLWQCRGAYPQWLSALPSLLREACEALGFGKLATHLHSQVQREEDAAAQVQAWFDGFRTLKLVHFLQAQAYPPLPHAEALAMGKLLYQDCSPSA